MYKWPINWKPHKVRYAGMKFKNIPLHSDWIKSVGPFSYMITLYANESISIYKISIRQWFVLVICMHKNGTAAIVKWVRARSHAFMFVPIYTRWSKAVCDVKIFRESWHPNYSALEAPEKKVRGNNDWVSFPTGSAFQKTQVYFLFCPHSEASNLGKPMLFFWGGGGGGRGDCDIIVSFGSLGN